MEDDPETASCNITLPGNLQIWYSEPADKYFVLLGDGTASVYILDVNGERQVFLTQHRAGTAADDINEMRICRVDHDRLIVNRHVQLPTTTNARLAANHPACRWRPGASP